jgi:hypothetical protein
MLARRAEEMRGRLKRPAAEQRARDREKAAFIRIAIYLRTEERQLREERYFTALHGCRTSWDRMDRAWLYAPALNRFGDRYGRLSQLSRQSNDQTFFRKQNTESA